MVDSSTFSILLDSCNQSFIVFDVPSIHFSYALPPALSVAGLIQKLKHNSRLFTLAPVSTDNNRSAGPMRRPEHSPVSSKIHRKEKIFAPTLPAQFLVAKATTFVLRACKHLFFPYYRGSLPPVLPQCSIFPTPAKIQFIVHTHWNVFFCSLKGQKSVMMMWCQTYPLQTCQVDK